MTYSAPKKNLFFLIVLLSALLHLLFFSISYERQASEQYRQVAESLVAELGTSMTVALANNDTVSASLIADGYMKEPQIGFVGVYDAKNNLIVPKGEEGAGGYRTRNQTVASGDKVLGSVVIETKPISYAIVLSEHWLFLLATAVLHLALFVLYGYLARPTEALKNQIATDVRARLLTQGLLPYQLQDKPSTNDEQAPTPSSMQDNEGVFESSDETFEDESDDVDGYVVQICFNDPNRLLDAVGYDGKQAYFALCNQLLEKTVDKLLASAFVAGVSVAKIGEFDEQGATVTLTAQNEHAKVATASLMLAQLVLMVNQVVYDKHRELGRFALPMTTIASSAEQASSAFSIAKRRRLPMLTLFNAQAKNQLAPYATLENLQNPNSISERECQTIDAMSHGMVERLNTLRDAVLLED